MKSSIVNSKNLNNKFTKYMSNMIEIEELISSNRYKNLDESKQIEIKTKHKILKSRLSSKKPRDKLKDSREKLKIIIDTLKSFNTELKKRITILEESSYY